MRLGQLARQLAIKSEQIVDFLASKNIAIDPGTNTRLEDDHIPMILEQFAVDGEGPNQLVVPEIFELESSAPVNAEPDSIEAPLAESSSTSEEAPELIKAPKVELPGLTVIGRIDLPEKKKKEPETETTSTPEESKPQRAFYQRPQRRTNESRSWKNPLTLEREREEREKRQRLEEDREKEKQRRTENYLKKVKSPTPTKAARLFQEEVIEMPPLEPERPRTWWARFIRWLNT